MPVVSSKKIFFYSERKKQQKNERPFTCGVHFSQRFFTADFDSLRDVPGVLSSVVQNNKKWPRVRLKTKNRILDILHTQELLYVNPSIRSENN